MIQEARLHRIRALLSTFNQVSTERIAQDLGVSRETVRRDILELEGQGALRRVHGGVVATEPQPELPLAVRQSVHAREKRAIARAAVQLVQPGQTLFLDTGSTTMLLAEELSTMSGLTIITNGLHVAQKLAAADTQRQSGNEVILLGGMVQPSLAATYGDHTVAEIHRYCADVALLSPVGLSSVNGATSFEHREAAVARAMGERARRLIILADSSKLGQSSRVVYAEPQAIDVIVTDAGARDLPELPQWSGQRCQVVLA
ncbi:DeoR/GlpR transcriptional regulator [Corticibacter populi]|uniref:DeoR/GlpR transcriptional regulator n=1 Tax=Corticibacter populi TaxID=1550736 RepID=A0A3M6QNX7_9BURK|nr:DeoR/GlpR family DNA-binding transcription regulator [Corticibacter populi]RMX04770.1 DeoR/GlpR transcriptional regulator [Corticibacter populi]RZS33820.1 DeoR family transcriptional regulator [Corticibacter populi]